MKKSQWIAGLVLLAALAGLFAYEQHVHPFDWRLFAQEFRKASWIKVGLGAGCIYLAFVFRGVRWAWLLRPNKRVPLFSLIGVQVMGFTAVALIGRVADLVRPYLAAKRTGLTVGSQFAVWVVERLFDTGSMALLLCTAILISPAGTLPRQDIFDKFGWGGLAATAAGALFLVAVRMWGEAIARFFEFALGRVSHGLGRAAGEKIRSFHTGLDTIRTPMDFAVTAVLSLAMWCLITWAYVEGAGAFMPGEQGGMHSLARYLVLMAGGGAASVFQVPILGWFTQIAALDAMLRALFGMTPEAAMACAATLLLITFLGIAPVGLVWAQFEHVNLRKVTLESEHAGEKLAAEATETPS